MFALGFDIRSAPVNVAYVDVESQCVDNARYEKKKAKGRFLLVLTGCSLSVDMSDITPVNPVISTFTLLTPGLLGPEAKYLSGPVASIGVAAALGAGLSYDAFTMGVGAGELSWTPSVVSGFSVGADFLGGIAIPIDLPLLRRCP